MSSLGQGFWDAWVLILTFDADLYEIIFLSLQVTVSAVIIGLGHRAADGGVVGGQSVPPAPLCDRGFERFDGPAAGGGRAVCLYGAVSRGAFGRLWVAVLADRDDHCAGHYHHNH